MASCVRETQTYAFTRQMSVKLSYAGLGVAAFTDIHPEDCSLFLALLQPQVAMRSPTGFRTVSWLPGGVSASSNSWIGCCSLQMRRTNQATMRRCHTCLKFVDTYHPNLAGLGWNNIIPRRTMLQVIVGIGLTFSLVDSTSAKPFLSMEELDIPRYYKTSSGVKVQDIVEGEGPAAREGDIVELNYVLRRSNGYFVYSNVDQLSGESKPIIIPLDEKQIIVGLKEALLGMKAGGKRRALVPPDVGYTNENLEPQPQEFGPRRSLLSHMKEPLVFEVQVLKVM